MTPYDPGRRDASFSRRELLARCGMGMGSLALATLLASPSLLQPPASSRLARTPSSRLARQAND